MTSTATRQKKKRKRERRRAQRMAWMVELRLAGFDRYVTDAVKEAGSHADAQRIYGRYIQMDPKHVNRKSGSTTARWTSFDTVSQQQAAMNHQIDAMRYAIDQQVVAPLTTTLSQTFYKDINYGIRSDNGPLDERSGEPNPRNEDGGVQHAGEHGQHAYPDEERPGD